MINRMLKYFLISNIIIQTMILMNVNTVWLEILIVIIMFGGYLLLIDIDIFDNIKKGYLFEIE